MREDASETEASMDRAFITRGEAAELSRLQAEYEIAKSRADAALIQYGMDSVEFSAADQAVGQVWRRIRQIEGLADQHWMS
jgi:hypothetical protein